MGPRAALNILFFFILGGIWGGGGVLFWCDLKPDGKFAFLEKCECHLDAAHGRFHVLTSLYH